MKLTRHLPFTSAALCAALFVSSVHAESILRTAGDFTLLGGSAITSTAPVGTVISNGNVGLSPTASSGITGFPPAVISNGAIIETGDATSQARLDFIAASAFLADLTMDTDLSNTELGGLELAPGVYRFDAAAAHTGALTLDAQFQNNVAWVFQIGTSLTTAVDSTVTVINLGTNGGSDLGIFWNTGAEIVIGATNTLAGNYLSGTSITLGASTDGGARLLALAAITLDQNEINAYGSPGEGDWNGGYSLIPEPAAVLWMAPLAAFAFVVSHRREQRRV